MKQQDNEKMNAKQFMISILIIMSILAGFFFLLNNAGWLSSDPVARLAMIDPTIAIPEWAESFYYDRGTYYFYEELPSQNPQKKLKIIGIVFSSWVVIPLLLDHLSKKYFTKLK